MIFGYETLIAIDPGASGGIAYTTDAETKAVNMPKTTKDMKDFLTYLKDTYPKPVIYIEKVSGYRGNADTDGGKNFGIQKMLNNYSKLTTVIEMLEIPYLEVYPISWQTTLDLKFKKGKGESDTKFKTRRKRYYKEYAQKHNPHLRVTLKTSDALCLIEFAYRKYDDDPVWMLDQLRKIEANNIQM